MYEKYSKSIAAIFEKEKIHFRPHARLGLWTIFLLPLAIITSSLNYPQDSFYNYKICSIFSIGLVATSLASLYISSRKKQIAFPFQFYLILLVATAFIIRIISNERHGFSIFSGFLSSIIYHKLLLFVLNTLPLSFTYGEATIITQAVTLFLYTATNNLYKSLFIHPTKNIEISTIVIQVGLLGIGLICFLTYLSSSLRKTWVFYSFFVISIFSFILLPLHVILKRSPLLWILNFLTGDLRTIALIIHWILCCMITVFVINKQINKKEKATTVVRKTFHFLAIAIFVPGFLYKCSILYLASGVVLGIFIVLELIRNIQLKPLSDHLQEGFLLYCDEKDAGAVALTPIYLLIGVSLPLWIHPAACDMTDSAGFNLIPLLSGVFTVGVGDTGASFIGTRFGKHNWPGSKKTIEGTVGCAVCQFLFLILLYSLGLVYFNYIQLGKVCAAIVITSLIEAFTSQVDNLVLPLISYIITV